MKTVTSILATSGIDRHGDRLTEGALRDIVEQFNSQWIRFGVEHDPRIAPAGRVRAARLVQRAGEMAVEGDIEIHEPGDAQPLDLGRAELKSLEYEKGELVVHFDRTYQTPEGAADVTELARILGARAVEEAKKAAEPVSVLTIGVGLLATGAGFFAAGFLKKMGEDAYTALKKKLKAIFARARADARDRLLSFRFAFEKDGVVGMAEVILTNPSPEDIDSFFAEGLAQLSVSIQNSFDPELGMRELTYEYRERALHLEFAVRLDAVPIFLAR